jgi:hypothetical protein
LHWSAVSGAVGYVLQRGPAAAGPYTLIGSITEPTYTNFGLNSNSTYYYKVTAVNAGGTSPDALTTTRPAAPASLTATPGNARVQLTWSTSIGATGYVIYRGTASGAETNTVATGITNTNYTDTNLINGVTYYYVVAALGSAASSGNSPEASATPAVPTRPTIGNFHISGNQLTLSATGGPPKWNCYLLESTNAAQPLGGWTRVATNSFDPAGNVSFTTTLSPNLPRQFFCLQSP